ncbi:flavodoxin family protein [Hymenobacter arizonensis]|uniref:Flavodoxin-like fold n=1 Tax=Hymenobacter arizonensis TaxID=1227077 RepID=A0A1I5TZY2_HYMAR|nr:NAD(P)H-dependent oxidoreductase [Hymenobacter arizonensis]SFP88177.1 Flavodoxin-like fold [Hymenobacter arizonensis]
MNDVARHFFFLLCSTRSLGNSEQLAYCAAYPLPPQTKQRWLHLRDFSLPEFIDMRHHGSFPVPTGNVQKLLDATLEATDLVLAAPLLWYSLPAAAKHYLDYWYAWMRTPNLEFREKMQGKTLWAIIVSSGSQADAAPLEASLMLTAQAMGMHWGGLLYGTGSRPNDIQQDAKALQRARTFFQGAPA